MKKIKQKSNNIEFHRCKQYPLYFFKNYLQLQGFAEFNLNQLQSLALKKIDEYPRTIFKKNRQIGMSTFFEAYFIWRLMFYSSETSQYVMFNYQSIMHISDKLRRSLENTIIHWNSVNHNSIWIKKNNRECVEISNGSELRFNSGKSSSRGYNTTGVIILDEAVFYDFLYTIIPTAVDAYKVIISSSIESTHEGESNTDFTSLYYYNRNNPYSPTMKAVSLSPVDCRGF